MSFQGWLIFFVILNEFLILFFSFLKKNFFIFFIFFYMRRFLVAPFLVWVIILQSFEPKYDLSIKVNLILGLRLRTLGKPLSKYQRVSLYCSAACTVLTTKLSLLPTFFLHHTKTWTRQSHCACNQQNKYINKPLKFSILTTTCHAFNGQTSHLA